MKIKVFLFRLVKKIIVMVKVNAPPSTFCKTSIVILKIKASISKCLLLNHFCQRGLKTKGVKWINLQMVLLKQRLEVYLKKVKIKVSQRI